MVKQFALDMQQAFPDITGFSLTNVKYMKRWYLFYNGHDAKSQRPVDQISHQVSNLLPKEEKGQRPVDKGLLSDSKPILHQAAMSEICTCVKPEQPRKASYPIFLTLLGIVTDVKLVQPLKAELSIDVTLLGIVTSVKPEQLRKAELPIDVTLLPIVTDVKPEQS